MPLPFNKSLDLKLLELVKENSVLYNTKHSKYLDFDAREVVWQKIGDALSRPAAEFAGIQCQIQFGDYQEDKHKPGFIENLSEFLPTNYINCWGIEKKVFKAHSKYQGLQPLDAKNTYIKMARELPTYGVTFFLVKEKQPGKMKLVPRLLGINAEAILRLDQNSKEILQQWPLTHVKTYHVGKSDTFTLKFGDWSDKEYSCKTQDVLRIRDILVGYIDLIQRRMLAKPQADPDESMTIYQDNIQSGQSHTMQLVSQQPTKPVQETFVGPTVLVPFEQGSTAHQGTTMMTVQQIIQTNQMSNPQQATAGGAAELQGRSGGMPVECVRKLKRMNSNSIKIVDLLTDPTEAHVNDARDKVTKMTEDFAVFEKGVKATVQQQTVEESKKMLLDEMQDLMTYMNQLVGATAPGHTDTSEAKDAAEKIADLTVKMTFAQDPKTRRRSELLHSSKKSFIAGEKMDATIRRASLIAAASTTLAGIDHANQHIAEQYSGPQVDSVHAQRLEKALQDNIGRLNAALALYLTAHSDPDNVDYPAAINSMHTIKELMRDLPADAQMLASTKDPAASKELLNDMHTLFEGTRRLCSLTEANERDKMQEACNKYAHVADKLIFTFTRGRNLDKENEIVQLSQSVGNKTSLLLMSANDLISQAATEPGAADLDAAGVRTAAVARDLMTCAQLTAPAINEAHCRSAMSAAGESLLSSIHKMSSAWKPLVADPTRHHLADELHQREMDVHKALEKLNNALSNVNDPDDESLPLQERQRLKYMYSLAGARGGLEALHYELEKPKEGAPDQSQEEQARQRLSQQLAQLNAAIAALSQATRDPKNPDYLTAELALNTITQLTPQIVKDMAAVSWSQDEGTRNAMQQHVMDLCEASKDMLANVERSDGFGDCANRYGAASSKLMFLISPGADKGMEKMMAKVSSEIYDNAAELVSCVPRDKWIEHKDAEVLAEKANRVDAANRGLLAVAQVTAPSVSDARCASALSAAVEELRSASSDLAAACQPHLVPGAWQQQQLDDCYRNLQKNIDCLEQLCQLNEIGDVGNGAPQRERKRLQFINSVADAKGRISAAEEQMKRPLACAMMREEDAVALEKRLSEKMALLNAAIAALSHATHDRSNPDYAKARSAADTISELMPQIIQESLVLCGTKVGSTQELMLNHVKQLCEASKTVCDNAGQAPGLSDAAARYNDASSKLMSCVSPSCATGKQKEIVDLSAASCVRASDLLSQVQALTQQVGGAVATDLDQRGAKIADAAQNLLAVAQVTSPSISSPQCMSSLESAVETLRESAAELTAACSPHAQPAARQHLSDSQQQLNHSLDELLRACRAFTGVPAALSDEHQDKQRLQFITSLSGARSCFDDAHQQLKQPVVCALMKESDAAAVQQQLLDRVSQLNAAIAALIDATSDRQQPDYAQAQQAISAITALTPLIVRDTRVLSGTKDGATQERMLQDLQRLCEASKAICGDGEQSKDLRDAAASFSQASRKLMFTVSPGASDDKTNQIVDLSAASCVRASELLSQVQALTQQVGGDVAAELDGRGASTADAAQNLLAVAQVTAPSISSPQCVSSLKSAVETLRRSAAELTAACSPHAQPAARQHLSDSQQQLNHSLDELLRACREAKSSCVPGASAVEQREKQRLQFINSLSGAKNCFDDAHARLEQPVVRELLRQEDAAVLEYQLSERMAQLNAAIAALALALHDRDNPDYATAQHAVNTITSLMPLLVQEAKSLSSTKESDAQKITLHQAQQLCDASKAICEQASEPQGLRAAAVKFADASSRLDFIISPRTKHDKEKQIVDLSAASCVRASDLLSQVQALTQQVGGDVATDLDQRGAKSADAAQALLTVAQVTAARMDSPHCQEALEKAVTTLRGSAAELAAACAPHVTPGDQQRQLQDSHKQLEISLDQLLQACRDSQGGAGVAVPAPQHVQRVEFIRSVSAVSRQLDDAEKEVKEPLVCSLMKSSESAMLQHQLTARLAQLNAAIAALTSATTDPQELDYTTAERAIITITKLMPTVVQDAKKMSCTKDDNCQRMIQNNLKELCEASRGICANAGDPKKLNEAAAKFALTSGQLVSLVGVEDQPQSAAVASSQHIKGKGPKPPVAIRSKTTAHAAPARHSCTTQDFLDNLRAEERKDKAALVVGVEVKEAKAQEEATRAHDQFSLAVNTAQDEIKYAQGSLEAISYFQLNNRQPASPGIDALELVRKEQHMEEMLGQAAVEVATLVSANYANKLDYKAAMRPVVTLTKAVRVAVEDGSAISGTLQQEARSKFVDDMMGLCDATQNICDASRHDSQKLNDAAIIFSNQSTKLLRIVGANVNPALEKEVMSRAKAIGDSASRLAMEASAVASSASPNSPSDPAPSHAQSICSAGALCVDAAGKLVYTAKLIAPTIHHSTCQDTLISSADSLSANLATFSNSWKPLAADPQTAKLTEEAKNLETLLENLKADVKNGKLGKQRDVGRMVTLDTPLRELTCQVIDTAKQMAEHGELSAEDKQQYAQYSGRLEQALRALDLAHARCQRAPHDKNRRGDMYAAIGDLEVLTLQSRPARAGLEMSNIVDFRDFLEGMVTESNKLMKAAEKHQTATGKRLADDIKVMCTKINEDAPKLLNPTQHVGDDTYDDIMEFEKFAQDCNLLAKELNYKIQSIPDQRAKVALRSKLLPLIENLNLLRFATNSAQSTAQSASYDAALQDLDNLQTNVVKTFVKRAKENKAKGKALYGSAQVTPKAQVRLLSAARGEPQALCRELTGYITHTLACAPSDEIAEDVITLVEAMQNVTEAHSLQAANGIRPGDHQHTITLKDTAKHLEAMNFKLRDTPNAAVNLGILARFVREATEAHSPQAADERPNATLANRTQAPIMKRTQILKDDVIDKLLTSESHKVQGTKSQVDEQFQQLAAKLNVMSSNILLSIKKPELAAKSLHITADIAEQLANTARSLQDETRPIQAKKIEDAAYAMSLATYSLLKTSETLCQEPNHPDVRRRLMEAIHLLNDAINKLERAVHSEPKVSRDCAEHLRSLQLQSALLQSSPQPVSASPYTHCLEALQSQRDVLLKLNSEQAMSREEFLQSMMFVTTAVGNSTECAAQAAYLISVSDNDKNLAREGLVDTSKMQKTIAAIHDSCVSVVMHPEEQGTEEKKVIEKLVDELLKDLNETVQKTKDQDLKTILKKSKEDVDISAKALYKAINENKPEDLVRDSTLSLIEDILYVDGILQNPALVPTAVEMSATTQSQYEDVIKHLTALVSKAQDLMKEIKSSPEQSAVLRWSSYSKRRDVLAAFDALVKSIKLNGQNASILEAEPDESEEKSYVQIQTDTAFKWLHKPMAKSDVKANGQQAARNLIDVGKKMTEHLSGADKEDMRHLVEETEQLLAQCCKRYDQEQYGLLMERIRELRKAIERVAVTRVVEDFMDAEEPLADLDILADAEKDEKTRKFLLERKIAELLAQLAGVTRAARFIADTGSGGRVMATKLKTCSEQTELLAPMLVKAAEERIQKPDDKAIIENYKALLAQYTESLSKVRELCDQSIDPMEFVQAAGETMQRMREESARHNDPMKCAYTSVAITKLANRVIHVGLSSSSARNDPELAQALTAAQQQLSAATPTPGLRASRMPDWKDTTAQILRATDEVEQVLGGENIFKNHQPDANQPIYNEALNLHEVTRGWSSRDNEIVAIAKRMAVLMAKLSAFMNTNKQREVLTTSKAIVAESHEVARLAKKLAHECSDHRIKTNLLQLCEKIPTISGQLKMLTTVKASSLGHQGTREDQEAMDMLVSNAQSLMISTRDVVNAANSASVKIMSQRGPRIKWVRKTYY